MKKIIIQTITNTLNSDRELIKTVTCEAFRITPDNGKVFRNKVTGKLYFGTITVSPESDLINFEEIDYIIED